MHKRKKDIENGTVTEFQNKPKLFFYRKVHPGTKLPQYKYELALLGIRIGGSKQSVVENMQVD